MSVPSIIGVGHIDLTVSNAQRSAEWWEQVLGFKLVNIEERARPEGVRRDALLRAASDPR